MVQFFSLTVRRLAVRLKGWVHVVEDSLGVTVQLMTPPTALHTGNAADLKLFTIVTIAKHSHRLCPSSPHVPLGGRDERRGSQLKEPLQQFAATRKIPLMPDEIVGVMWIMSDKSVNDGSIPSWLPTGESVQVLRAMSWLTAFLQRLPQGVLG